MTSLEAPERANAPPLKKFPRARIQLNTRLLPFLVVALSLLQLIAPYKGWTIFLVGLGGAWLIAYLWARSLARGLALQREIRFGWAQVGDHLEERFTLINKSSLPALWLEVQDHSTLPDYQASTATGIGGDEKNWWRREGVCIRRGQFVLGATTLRSGDPFGIYTISVHIPASTNLLVMPPIVSLPSIQIASGREGGEGRSSRRAFEPTISAAGIRDYAPGDHLRWIHWRASARRDSLSVRLFDHLGAGNWWIILDLDERAQAGAGQASTLEHGVILAVSLAEKGIRSGRAVGLVSHGRQLDWVPPRAGQSQRWEIARTLALAESGARSLGELLALLQPALRQPDSVIVITPDTEGNWVNQILQLNTVGSAATILLFDPSSYGVQRDPNHTMALLGEFGVARYLITRDFLDVPRVREGQQGAWDWKVTPGGRAIAGQAARDQEWRTLQ